MSKLLVTRCDNQSCNSEDATRQGEETCRGWSTLIFTENKYSENISLRGEFCVKCTESIRNFLEGMFSVNINIKEKG